MRHHASASIVGLAIACPLAFGQATFQDLGEVMPNPFSGKVAVSRSGEFIVTTRCSSGSLASKRWHWDTGTDQWVATSLPATDGRAVSLSETGRYIVGSQAVSGLSARQAFSWDAQAVSPGITALTNDYNSVMAAVTRDGTVAAGAYQGDLMHTDCDEIECVEDRMPVKWTLPSTKTALPLAHISHDSGFVTAFTESGHDLVGSTGISGALAAAVEWITSGSPTATYTLAAPVGGSSTVASDITPSGSHIVGQCSYSSMYEPALWSGSVGSRTLQLLGEIDPMSSPHSGSASAVTDNGAIIVGISEYQGGMGCTPHPCGDAFIWDTTNGMRSLKDVLEASPYNLDLTGWDLVQATGISGGGRVIVGEGWNPEDEWVGWVARLGTSGCRIDYNDDGLVDFGDYLLFLGYYDLEDPLADLNDDELVDFSDYLEFLSLFDGGC